MLRLRYGLYVLQALLLVPLLVLVRIVPGLPLPGAKYYVEYAADDVNGAEIMNTSLHLACVGVPTIM